MTKSDHVSCNLFIARCPQPQFECDRETQCLPESSRCNGVVECRDRTDELNCSKYNNADV